LLLIIKYNPINAGNRTLKINTVKEIVIAVSDDILYFERISIANFSRNPKPAYVIGIRLENNINGTETIAEKI